MEINKMKIATIDNRTYLVQGSERVYDICSKRCVAYDEVDDGTWTTCRHEDECFDKLSCNEALVQEVSIELI